MATKEELVSKKIGRVIAKKRRVAGFTQDEVAERLGIGNEAFSRIERGLVKPDIFKLYEMADMFEIGIDAFFIEGSRRPTDQGEHVAKLLSRLPVQDQQLVMGIVERLTRRLATRLEKEETRSGLLI